MGIIRRPRRNSGDVQYSSTPPSTDKVWFDKSSGQLEIKYYNESTGVWESAKGTNDMITVENKSNLPLVGESNKIYVVRSDEDMQYKTSMYIYKNDTYQIVDNDWDQPIDLGTFSN